MLESKIDFQSKEDNINTTTIPDLCISTRQLSFCRQPQLEDPNRSVLVPEFFLRLANNMFRTTDIFEDGEPGTF